MARAREEALRHGTRHGMLRGLAVTGGVITSAGIALAGTFTMLATLPLKTLTELGFTIAIGILLDTFIVRSVLVPALVFDIGARVWWPSALARKEETRYRRGEADSVPRTDERHPERPAALAASDPPGRPELTMERVWDYPRPPAVVPCERRVRVELAGAVLADSTRALRVLETSHPPTIYIPLADVREELLAESDARSTWCEFKGPARYLDAIVDGRRFKTVGWSYPDPSPGYEALRDHVAFYPGRVDAAWLDDERVQAQQGDFYGGWITAGLIGPFKGPRGTLAW